QDLLSGSIMATDEPMQPICRFIQEGPQEEASPVHTLRLTTAGSRCRCPMGSTRPSRCWRCRPWSLTSVWPMAPASWFLKEARVPSTWLSSTWAPTSTSAVGMRPTTTSQTALTGDSCSKPLTGPAGWGCSLWPQWQPQLPQHPGLLNGCGTSAHRCHPTSDHCPRGPSSPTEAGPAQEDLHLPGRGS
uniref:Uncharacterized protein n=1 Tax=Gorilla gorilla gorilla TaxID=9595 RepID=A0A2I2YN62_GORGO